MRVLEVVLMGSLLLAGSEGRMRGGEPMLQSASQSGQPAAGLPGVGNAPGPDSIPRSVAERQEMARNSDRQKRLVTDADKLLALATDLKLEVGKTNKDVMSLEVIKKAEEIEKLAHSVKERMKG